MTLKVHILYTPDGKAQAALLSSLDRGVMVSMGPDLPDEADFEILVAGRPDEHHLTASPALNTLVVPFAGIPDTTRELLLHYPQLAVHNLHHNAQATAELAISLLLAAAKWIVPFDKSLRSGDWTPRYQESPAALLYEKTALILGFGHIGQRIARICQAIGMQVIAVRNDPSKPLEEGLQAEVHAPSNLPSLWPRADTLILSLPLTPQTQGLINRKELEALPPGAILINVGRGAIVNESSLYQALQTGRLRSAGLDVWYQYPEDETQRKQTYPSRFPFHQLENVVMSPHRGGKTEETEPLRMRHLAALLNTYHRGETLPNAVNIEAGY
jgi:phosphoglycerate dehydrogenase-like enzyme